ncbi:MAG: McrB family protein [Phocaeicola sp.]
MGRTDYINQRADILDNMLTLYSYLNKKQGDVCKNWAIGRMKQGKNFVAEVIDEQLYFAPSRFVGYLNNTKEKHEENHGDGTDTDREIKRYYQKVSDERIDELFQKEIEKYGIATGTKKFWISKDITIEELLAKAGVKAKKYWVARLTDDNHWYEAVKSHTWRTQQRYGLQKTSAVTGLLNLLAEVKEGDVLILSYKNKIHAYGYAVKCPYKSDQKSAISSVTDNKSHDYSSGIVRFSDSEVFYEDLEGCCDNWGQRIMVDQWHYYSDDSKVTTNGMFKSIEMGISTMSFIGVKNTFAESKITELRNQYQNKHMEITKVADILRNKKNIILQGAPGTGKTYNTATIALSILGITDVDLNDHNAVMERYDSLQDDQIFFTTFHQSLDYEDFVEGLKPQIQTDSNGNSCGVTYEPEDGIFKRACQAVQTDSSKDIVECIDEFLETIKGFENKKEIPTITGNSSLYVWWKEGNTTISTRSVNSLSTKPDGYSPSPLNINKIKLQAQGKGCENNWQQYAQAFIQAVKEEYLATKNKSVVLIIDEINRGNVSKIFGELITLLESDKRDSGNHPIKVLLPHSKTLFGVPSNLYIIGTMNTTDRSTGTLDYALRRRFAFVTMKSKVSVIEEHYDTLGDSELKETAAELFKDIKSFIENPKHLCGDFDIDDLMIGHSYFMASTEDELKDKVVYEIIPLLSEYINDGILNITAAEKKKAFESWRDLSTIEIKNISVE